MHICVTYCMIDQNHLLVMSSFERTCSQQVIFLSL